MIIVGLTGGIASGKSTVTNLLRELGVEVIDADAIAREIVMPGQPALPEIVEAFGPELIGSDGQLERSALGARIFSNATERAKLNQITHPRIAQAMMDKAREAFERGHDWVVYDAALLVENGIHHFLDSLIVVAAERETQIARITERDGLERAQAEARIDAQMPLEAKIAAANYVIDNNHDIARLRRQVLELFESISKNVRERGTAKPNQPVDTNQKP
ncbi:MAG: dephospho-CoA kinase [Bradymonadaceae bacterium]|nr:dephospho-CoA kinase [Lujinxingiaceae bacterium]